MTALLLASASPRRHELLSAILPRFEVRPSDVLEDVPARTGAADAVALLAERKAGAIAPATPDAAVLAADTLVSWGDRLFGKPLDAEMARAFLRTLRGRTHSVQTGVCLRSRRGTSTRVVRTGVVLRRFSDGEIEASIEAGIPFDKAGAYAIQDTLLNPVERIDGCYCNVMGLPLWDVWEMVAVSGLESVSAVQMRRGPSAALARDGRQHQVHRARGEFRNQPDRLSVARELLQTAWH